MNEWILAHEKMKKWISQYINKWVNQQMNKLRNV